MDASIGQFSTAGIKMTQSNRQYPLRSAVTDMLDNQPQVDNGRQPLGNSEPETCGAGEPSSPRAICPLGPGPGQGQKPKGLRGHPGRNDCLPGAGLRCTFAQRGWFGGSHVSSAALISPSAQSRPRPYVWGIYLARRALR